MIPKAQAIDSKETRRLAPRLVSLLLRPYPLRLLSYPFSLLSSLFSLLPYPFALIPYPCCSPSGFGCSAGWLGRLGAAGLGAAGLGAPCL